jgi:hypothetical protein
MWVAPEGQPQSVGKTIDKPPFYAYSRHLSNSYAVATPF